MIIKNTLSLALLASVKLAKGHTWLEQLNRISSNGTFIEPAGFPFQWVSRNTPQFNDELFNMRIPQKGTQLCKLQPLGKQNEDFPVLQASPGEFVALRYLENGHVTVIEEGRPKNRGTVYVYGTTNPRKNDDLADVFKQWTPDGKGGNGRGRLLATRNFDDGQCYEVNDRDISSTRQKQFPKTPDDNGGPNLWCQTDIQIPHDVPAGSQFTLYWIWTWPLLHPEAYESSQDGQYGDFAPGTAPKGLEALEDPGVKVAEIYSSCAAISVIEPPTADEQEPALNNAQGSNAQGGSSANKFIDNPAEYNNMAIKEQLETPFLVNVNAPGATEQPNVPKPTSINTQPPAPTTTSTKPRVVTVTAAPTTVRITATVVAGRPSSTAPATDPTPTPAGPGSPFDGPDTPMVEPFMARRGLRGRPSWAFGRDN